MTTANAIDLTKLHQLVPEMTPKQKDCLLLWILGLSIESIATENGVSQITVRKHLDAARNSMGGVPLSSLRTIILLRMFALLIKE
ncbi:Sigma-70, region 4 [Serratia fonticola]|uniref:helix-turn-helix transcriptional regulator n=1 Tax=Serratia fonticola TaxID=47917 RepID=UPI002179880D|nr:sigma factor-like helix-turn-helix DNA-binding protein [Serratia fonticola]CAI1544214.1 Sigma-70, region 4 [Serratia fonticola]